MPSGRVSLFVTCIVDQVFAKVGFAMADVLERAGYKLDFPPAQTCCGQPAFNYGYRESSRQVARHFLDVFRHSEYIVVPSGSCTAMISHHYDDIFENDPEMRKKMIEQGMTPWPARTPEQAMSFLRQDSDFWLPIIKASGATAE